MHFSGDRTGPAGGLVGKVLGPGADGRWHVVVDARYDAENDRTETTTQAIQSPEDAFKALMHYDTFERWRR